MSNTLDELKYKEYVLNGSCGVCPPVGCKPAPAPIQAIRYGLERQPTARDFVPVYVETPKRALGKSHWNQCSGYGLSFYTTTVQARARLQQPAKFSKKLTIKWKSLLATTIYASDGLITDVSVHGHFDLHEFRSARLELQSVYLEDL